MDSKISSSRHVQKNRSRDIRETRDRSSGELRELTYTTTLHGSHGRHSIGLDNIYVLYVCMDLPVGQSISGTATAIAALRWAWRNYFRVSLKHRFKCRKVPGGS